ncbi:MAG: DNA methyltransferase [Patescibacteria group bacterium]
MTYFFVLGNNPTLSIAEITAVFSGWPEIVNDQLLILDSQENIQALQAIEKLGGTIKIGVINSQCDKKDYQKILKDILLMIEEKEISGKFKFGISNYGAKTIKEKNLGLDIKKCLKNKNISCRWVTSSGTTLSSVVVEQNKLVSKGIEIILAEINNKILIGQTLAVQPFKKLSFRDYGRPGRDDFSGMLPPKLARIMLNLADVKIDKTILDPFCGSGTILTEAMLMGYKNVIGSDISLKAVEDTKKNIEWTKDNFQFSIFNFQLINANATQMSEHLPLNSVDAIITEPYLGPQRGKIEIKQVLEELNNLYSQSLTEFYKILKPTGRIVMVWPIFTLLNTTKGNSTGFNLSQGLKRLSPNLSNFEIINSLPQELLNDKKIKLTDRQTIIYCRPNQKVWREIVVLEKRD